MDIYIIRHGETSWNRAKRLQGQQGADLDEEGVLLAEMTSQALADVPFDICFTSPLVRARHTAELIVGSRQIPIIEDPRIMEISFGEWEGKSCDLKHMEIPLETYMAFHDDSYHYIPPIGGERIQDVIARCRSFLDDITQRQELRDKTVLVSTHGCATRALLNHVYTDNSDFWHGGVPMNCAVNLVRVRDGKCELVMEDQVYYPKKYFHAFYDEQLAKEIEEEETEANENK